MPTVTEVDSTTGRANQRAESFEEFSRSFDRKALGVHTIDSGKPLRFAKEFTVVGNDAVDPNASEPVYARTVPGDDVNYIGIYPRWAGASQAVVLHVWVKDPTDTNLTWRRVAIINFDTATDVKQVIATGNRTVYVQVVSGADAGHPLTVHYSAC